MVTLKCWSLILVESMEWFTYQIGREVLAQQSQFPPSTVSKFQTIYDRGTYRDVTFPTRRRVIFFATWQSIIQTDLSGSDKAVALVSLWLLIVQFPLSIPPVQEDDAASCNSGGAVLIQSVTHLQLSPGMGGADEIQIQTFIHGLKDSLRNKMTYVAQSGIMKYVRAPRRKGLIHF